MKVFTEQEVQKNFDELLDDIEQNPVIVLRDRKVACVMVGAEFCQHNLTMTRNKKTNTIMHLTGNE